MGDDEIESTEIVGMIRSLPTTNSLFHTASDTNPRARLPRFTDALGAYSIAKHILKTLSDNPKRGLDLEEAQLLSKAATTLVELENEQKDGEPNQKMDLTVKGKPVSSLLLDIMDKSPSREQPLAARGR
jgi:hypothetical protein